MSLIDAVIFFYKNNRVNTDKINLGFFEEIKNMDDFKELKYDQKQINSWVLFFNYFLIEKENDLELFLNKIPKENLQHFIFHAFCKRKRKSVFNSFYILFLHNNILKISFILKFLENKEVQKKDIKKILANINSDIFLTSKHNQKSIDFYFSEIAPYNTHFSHIFKRITKYSEKHLNGNFLFIKNTLSMYYYFSNKIDPERNILLKDSLLENLNYLLINQHKYKKGDLLKYFNVIELIGFKININQCEILNIKKDFLIKLKNTSFNSHKKYRVGIENIFKDVKSYLLKSNFITQITNYNLNSEEFYFSMYQLSFTSGSFKLIKHIHKTIQLNEVILKRNIDSGHSPSNETFIYFDRKDLKTSFFSLNNKIVILIKKLNIDLSLISPDYCFLNFRFLEHKNKKLINMIRFIDKNIKYFNIIEKYQGNYFINEDNFLKIDLTPYILQLDNSEFNKVQQKLKKIKNFVILDIEYLFQTLKDSDTSRKIKNIFD